MRERPPGNAVDGRIRADSTKVELFDHSRKRHLSRSVSLARIRPRRTEMCGQYARRQPGGAHANEDALDAVLLQILHREVVTERLGVHTHLYHLCACLPHRTNAFGEVAWHAVKIVQREHNSPAMVRPNQIIEARAELEIHVLGSMLKRRYENFLPLTLGTGEPAALRLRSAGDDDG